MSQQKIPAGYKQTEIGVIPEVWEVSQLGSCASFIGSGKTNTKRSGSFPLYGSTGLIGSCKKPEYQGEALLVARVGANAGKLNLVNGKYGVSDNTIIVNMKPENNIHYFKFWLQRKNLNTMVFGSGQPLITGTQLKELPLPLPKEKEQAAIAKALSDVDALISEQEKLIAKKQAIKTATMQQLLTGKTRLPQFAHHPDGTPKITKHTELGEIPEDWEVKSLNDLSFYINDGTHHTPKYVSDGVPFYSVENVSANDFENVKYISIEEHNNLIKRCRPEKGDLLMTRIGTLGKTRVIDWDVNASIYVSLALIKLRNNVDPNYVYVFSKSRAFRLEVEKRSLLNATPQKINMSEIREVPVPYPINKKEQTAIAQILSDMDSEIQALEQRLNKTRQIKHGMMQQLLTGKIRLIKKFERVTHE